MIEREIVLKVNKENQQGIQESNRFKNKTSKMIEDETEVRKCWGILEKCIKNYMCGVEINKERKVINVE